MWKSDETTLFKGEFDGEEWEIREDNNRAPNYHELVYASHISCDFSEVDENTYTNLWSWEEKDLLTDRPDQEVPWCHYCWTPVPEGVIALVKIMNMDRG